MEPLGAKQSERILIRTPYGQDAAHLAKILNSKLFETSVCTDAETLLSSMNNAGAILTTEEVLRSDEGQKLIATLKLQPSWSNIPIVAFFAGVSADDGLKKRATHPLQEFAEIVFVQRPIDSGTLISSVVAALKDRRKQYQLQTLLLQLENEIEQKEQYQAQLERSKSVAESARAQAEVASTSKSQFLANMSHEIRTPLGAIMGFLDLLKMSSNSPQDIKNYIDVIDRNSSHLLRLIDDILDLSKIEAGRMSIEEIEFSLADVIADCTSLMGYKARDKGVLFILKLMTPIPTRVISDPTRVRQILTNVVGNAIKFTEQGRVDLIIDLADDNLIIKVVDTGVGISEENRKKLFMPFAQADASTTRDFGGTGLGLVLTRHLTEAMGGSFTLEESTPGAGSTFVARIKIKSAAGTKVFTQLDPESNHGDDGSVQNPLAGLSILVVEDSPDNQTLLHIVLTKLGARVEMASDGQEGVTKALGGPYDLVLMDVQMPTMDGHQATRKLRSGGYDRSIVALTAHAMKEERERTVASGFTDFLSKPIEKDSLISVILTHAHSRS